MKQLSLAGISDEARRRVYSEPLGEKAREAGIDRVETGAGFDWLNRAMAAVHRLARSRATFTSDDLWKLVGDPPGDPRALGAVMRGAARDKLCETTGTTVKSQRVVCHRRPIAVWRSLLHTPSETPKP